MKGEGAGFSAGFSALGISTPSGAGITGFSAFINGLVFLSCSEVAKSRPFPDLKNLSSSGFADLLEESISLNLGRDSFAGAAAKGDWAGLSNVPPSFGKAGTEAASDFTGSAGLTTGLGSGAGVGGVTAELVSGALKGLKALIGAWS